MSQTVLSSKPHKRKRRTKAEIETLKAALYDIGREVQPSGVRNIFYQMTVRGLIDKTEAEYDVPLMPAVGFSSLTFLHETAINIKDIGKPTYIYCFGDFDPSGVIITRNIEKRLEEFGAEFTFERVAVNEEQIKQYSLPSRPTKRHKKNTHAKNFDSDVSVEIDAFHPSTLRQLVRDCIEQHIDDFQLEQLRAVECAELDTLDSIEDMLGGADR